MSAARILPGTGAAEGSVEAHEQRYILELSPHHQLPVFCTGAGMHHVLHASGQPVDLSCNRATVCGKSERQKSRSLLNPANKVDVAYQMLTSDTTFVVPQYIKDAIEWLRE